MNLCIRLSLRGARLGAALVVLAFCAHAYADVRLPNGEYTTTIEDLKVKVIGGYVTIARSWTNGRWYANPQWADLKFTYDSLDGSVRGIDRAGTIYERTSAGLYVYKIDQPFYILKNATGWRWYDPKGNSVTYDPDGHLTAYGDRNVQVTFTLDGSGRHTQVQDQLGQLVLSFQYSGDQLTSVSDRAGRQVRYQYTSGNLTQVIDVLGNTSSYTYDSNGQLTSLTDQEGHTTTIVYAQSTKAGNAGGGVKAFLKADSAAAASVASTGATPHDYKIARVFTITDPEGNTTTYLYDYDRIAQRFTVTQKFPSGRTVTGVYDALGRLRQQTVGTRIVSTMTRDGDRTEMIADERGLIATTIFDGAWNPIKVTYPDGTSVTATNDSVFSNPLTRTDEAGTQTAYQYDGRGNLTQMTEAVGLPEQRVTTYSYDTSGQRLTQTRKGATAADDATTRWTYDGFGNVQTMTDAIGNASAYTFDVMGNVLTQVDPRGNTWLRAYTAKGWLMGQSDPLGHGNTYTFDKVGNRTKLTDTLGNSTTFAYNRCDWLIRVTDALGGSTQFQYDAEGRKIQIKDANNAVANYAYDADGRLSIVTDGNGNVIHTVYGDNTNALNGLVASMVYPTYTESYKYDARNRVTQVIQALDQSTSYSRGAGFDGKGNIVTRTDPLGRTTLSQYDALNRLTQATDAIGGITAFNYDVRDNLLAVTDANGNTTRYTYDLANRKLSERRPLGGTTQYGYDSNGNLIVRTNAKGEQRRSTYDAANRRAQEQQYGATSGVVNGSPSRTIGFSFDARNFLTGYDDGTTSASYGYDGKGQKLVETVHFGSFSKTLQYGYQANGKKASFTYADNTQVSYTYDTNNQLKSIVAPQGTIAYDSYRWRAPTQISMPGAVRTISYDALLRPTEIKAQAIGGGTAQSPQGAVLMDYRYAYDAAWNILQRTTQDGPYLYTYDNLDRLTGASPPASLQLPGNSNGLPVEAYTYDSVHNRLSSQHQPGLWTYNSDNQLLSYGQGALAIGFQYDANGHTSKKNQAGQEQNLSYDPAERLVSVTDNASNPIGSYYYDPFGRRLKKTAGGQTTWFQYADEGLVAEFDISGNQTKIYGWQPGGMWGTNPQFQRIQGQTYYYHNDHLGTSQQLVDPSGNVTWRGNAEAFGKTIVDVSATVNQLRFPGQYHDSEAETRNNYYRDYDPSTGKYEQSDPMGLLAGPNTFVYTYDNPMRMVDPLGLECWWVDVGNVEKCVPTGLRRRHPTQEYQTEQWFPVPDPTSPSIGIGPTPSPPQPGWKTIWQVVYHEKGFWELELECTVWAVWVCKDDCGTKPLPGNMPRGKRWEKEPGSDYDEITGFGPIHDISAPSGPWDLDPIERPPSRPGPRPGPRPNPRPR